MITSFVPRTGKLLVLIMAPTDIAPENAEIAGAPSSPRDARIRRPI